MSPKPLFTPKCVGFIHHWIVWVWNLRPVRIGPHSCNFRPPWETGSSRVSRGVSWWFGDVYDYSSSWGGVSMKMKMCWATCRHSRQPVSVWLELGIPLISSPALLRVCLKGERHVCSCRWAGRIWWLRPEPDVFSINHRLKKVIDKLESCLLLGEDDLKCCSRWKWLSRPLFTHPSSQVYQLPPLNYLSVL